MNPIKGWAHDPDAILDYTISWADWLATGDAIDSATWTVPVGVTKVSQVETTTLATIEVSGGTAGTSYDLTCHIVTTDGREDDRTIRLYCRER